MSDHLASGFGLREERRDGVPVLRPEGELDVSAAPLVRECLLQALQEGLQLLVVDCSGLTFLDSSGISVLVHAHLRLAGQGGELRLAALPARIARVLELAGLLEVLPAYESLEEALGAVPGKAP